MGAGLFCSLRYRDFDFSQPRVRLDLNSLDDAFSAVNKLTRHRNPQVEVRLSDNKYFHAFR